MLLKCPNNENTYFIPMKAKKQDMIWFDFDLLRGSACRGGRESALGKELDTDKHMPHWNLGSFVETR